MYIKKCTNFEQFFKYHDEFWPHSWLKLVAPCWWNMLRKWNWKKWKVQPCFICGPNDTLSWLLVHTKMRVRERERGRKGEWERERKGEWVNMRERERGNESESKFWQMACKHKNSHHFLTLSLSLSRSISLYKRIQYIYIYLDFISLYI